MAFCDFVVRFDPAKDTPEELTKRILYAVWVKRLKAHKPCVVFMGGDSGEGKSLSVCRLQEIMFEVQGIEVSEQYFKAMNVFTPLQYPQKIDALLYAPELKKVNIITMHEAREVVKAKNWQSFLSQSVSDINAMSRSLKRLCVFVISQFIRDITTDIRYTLNYYCIVRRPKGKKPRVYINVMWKDDRDLEKPKLRKRKLSGYIVGPDGRWRRFVPQYLEMSLPKKETVELFERLDYEAKAGIIRKKLDRLLEEMKADIGEQSRKVESMVEFYVKNPDNLNVIGKQYRGDWKLRPEAREMHDLSKGEAQRFEKLINEAMKKKGVIQSDAHDESEEVDYDGESQGD